MSTSGYLDDDLSDVTPQDQSSRTQDLFLVHGCGVLKAPRTAENEMNGVQYNPVFEVITERALN
jgi:hypothetical protein